MALCIPEPKMLNIAPARWIWPIMERIRFRGEAEQLLPASAAMQLIGLLHRMASLMTENGHALRPSASLDVEHHFLLELHQAGMGEIERDGNARRLVGTKPFARDPGVGSQPNAPLSKLFVKSFDAVLEPRAFDRNLQTAQAPPKPFLIRQRLPSVFPARHRVSDTRAVDQRDGVTGR